VLCNDKGTLPSDSPPSMDRVISYKGFQIRTFEQAPDHWVVEIPKANGSLIRSRGELQQSFIISIVCNR
jgi:hypothetical protein